jgi:uncharacterized membrane protein SpoIIM required for sporulation
MAEVELKSTQFRREREQGWLELEQLIGRIERTGPDQLAPDELARLPMLYRAALSSLSVARSISLDRNLLLYLEGLAARAYLCVYGSHASLGEALAAFFRSRWPAAVRGARWHLLVAGLCMALGVAVGWMMVAADPDAFYGFVDEGLAGGRTPAASTESLRQALYDSPGAVEELTLFASFLFSHNAGIGMLAFALGFAFAVPTVILLFVNGLTLGAFLALYDSRGLVSELIAWLMIHGTTELFAIVLCGAAGLMIGEGVVFPGPRSRLANLARRGREAATLVAGAVLMLFVAALLEGLGRQLVADPLQRTAIGAGALALWSWYFIAAGRRNPPRMGPP